MKISITLAELNNVVDSLNAFVKMPLPAKYAYRFAKVAKSLQSRLMLFRQERDNLIIKHGEKTAEGGWKVMPSKTGEFMDEINTVQREVIELEFEPMPISVLDNQTVSIADMAWMEKFFVEDENISAGKKEGNPLKLAK